MTPADVLGIFVVLVFMAVVACLVAYSNLPRALKLLVYAALALRLVGAWLRYTVLFAYYGGSGDARGYYGRGLRFAERFWQLDFSPFFDSSLWHNSKLWGTSFMSFPSGIILTGIGPSLLGEFLAFSLLAFLGLVGFVVAFRRAYPDTPATRYARWVWLFPSLWFWPSSVGKEAIILMGLGLAVVGFIGRNWRINWPLLIIGMFFVLAIRPQMVAIVIVSFVLAHWMSFAGPWTVGRAVQGLLVLAVGLSGIWLSMRLIGVGGFDVEGVQDYLEATSASAPDRGSSVENVEVGLRGVPMALVNIMSRPFVWEASNPLALVSALEIAAFWIIVWLRRRNLVNALRSWRSHHFLRVAVPFILMYAIALGMVVVNLGIIARQRIFLFPFLFLLLEAVPVRRTGRSPKPGGVRPSEQHPDPVGLVRAGVA